MASTTIEQLRCVLKGDGFGLAFQPIIDLRNGQVVGFEALSRFADGVQSPADWFADGRDHGLSSELESLAVRMAVEEMRRRNDGRFVTVNVSAETMIRAEFVNAIPDDLSNVVFEISDYSTTAPPKLAVVAAQARRRGAKLAVDDVAGPHATLRQLLQIDCELIKLDMDLLHRAISEPRARALAHGLAIFSRETGMTMVAKGIEREAERDVVIALEIPLAQGFLLGRPQPWPTS